VAEESAIAAVCLQHGFGGRDAHRYFDGFRFLFHQAKLADLRPATIITELTARIHRAYARSVKVVSDLRVVYEFIAQDENDEIRNQGADHPQKFSDKQPGRTDKTNPVRAEAQNRADEIGRNLRVLALECPLPERLDLVEENAMKCAVHSDVDAVGFCRAIAARPWCSTCVRPVRDVLYCEECLRAS